MQKPLINNRLLARKWRDQETLDLNAKVKFAKPEIKTDCPESFYFRKTNFPDQTINGI